MKIFEIMKEENLLDWNLMMIGLERGWCTKNLLCQYAELCIAQTEDDQVDSGLISIIFDNSLNEFDLINIVKKIALKNGLVLQDIENYVNKWRYIFLIDVLQGEYSYDQKIDRLEDIYHMFGCPSDMYACLVYNDSVTYTPPLIIARRALEGLRTQLNMNG